MHQALFGRKCLRFALRHGVHCRPSAAKLPGIESGEEVHGKNYTRTRGQVLIFYYSLWL